ncbi:MAG: EAL domain-containing protein [Gemmatimonadales bacterium]
MTEERKTGTGRDLRILEHLLVGEGAERVERVGDVVFDSVTHLPTLQLLLKEIHEFLEEREQVGLLTVHVSPYAKLEELFGWTTFDEVLHAIAEELAEIKTDHLRQDDAFAELSMSGNSFVIVLSPPRYNRYVRYAELDRLRARVYKALDVKLAQRFPPEVTSKLGCFIGCAVVNKEPGVGLQRLIFRAVDQAYNDAFQEQERALARRADDIRRIIDERLVTAVVQPIVDLSDQRTLGFEAFARGPEGDYHSPAYLLKVAYDVDLLWQLERVCRERALEMIHALASDVLLFVNIDPDSVFDPELDKLFGDRALAERVVLEVTERAGIRDYGLFRRALERIRGLGLRVAIDDVGSAYAGLRLIKEVEPDLIKLDAQFMQGALSDVVARELMAAVLEFSRRTEIPAVVEGVETQQQLALLRELGARYAQGYLFGRPSRKSQEVNMMELMAQFAPTNE